VVSCGIHYDSFTQDLAGFIQKGIEEMTERLIDKIKKRLYCNNSGDNRYKACIYAISPYQS
jgi:hypothetical protein